MYYSSEPRYKPARVPEAQATSLARGFVMVSSIVLLIRMLILLPVLSHLLKIEL